MYIKTFKQNYEHIRTSKLGKSHTYKRSKSVNLFQCDSCELEFLRDQAKMDPKRTSNRYFHVCPNCDAKKFAQKKGVEKRKIWDLPVSSSMPIGRL